MALNTKTSVVDYLKSKKQDSSFGARSKLAQTHGITGYKGSAQQNTQLLSKLRGGGVSTQPVQPKVTTQATQPKVVTTTAVQPKTTTTAQQPLSAIEREEQNIQNSQQQFKDFLKGSSDSYYETQKAMLDAQKAERLTELQKALDQAIADGRISEEEAQKQLQAETEAINSDAYLASQATDLSAQSRGIGNSQQLLAMQMGDQRHANDLRSDARVARDERINQIKERLSQIKNNHNLDVALTNDQYNANLRGARGQADMMYNQGMSEMNMAQYKQALETKGQLTVQEQEQLNMLERMEKQYGYDLSKMAVQQQYTQDNMNLQYKLDLSKMKTQHGYDMEKIDTQFKNDLSKMAKQHGYDMSKIGAQHRNQMASISASHKNAMAQANAKKQAEENQLKNSYLDPNSWEYKVRMQQINESHTNAYDQAYNKAMGEAKGIFEAEQWTAEQSKPKTTSSSNKSSGGSWWDSIVGATLGHYLP